MNVNARGNSLPQTLTLVEKVLEYQDYIPIASSEDIEKNRIYPNDLSDIELSRLVADLSSGPKINRQSQDYTLVEGIMDKESEHLDGKLLVVIKYDFVRSQPLIEVPGMIFAPGQKDKISTLSVRLLTPGEWHYFVQEVLFKENIQRTGSMLDKPYTGLYKVWPYGIELKSREAKI